MSKTVKVSWPMGQFLVSLVVPVTEENEAIIVAAGAKALGQSVQVDKALGGFEVGEDGKEVRKAGWKRGQVGYTPELAKAIEAKMAAFKVGKVPMGFSATVGPNTDFEDAKFIVSNHESKGDLETWLLDKVEYAGDTHGEDGEYSVEMLVAVTNYAAKTLAAQAAALQAAKAAL